MIKRSREDLVVDLVVYFILIAVFILIFYPFYYAVIISFNEGVDATRGGIYFWPRKFTLENYGAVFNNSLLLSGFSVTILRTVVGTILSLFCTSIFAFTLSHRKLIFRRAYVLLVIICIYFSGGLIPYFILLKNLGLINNFAVYIVPALIFPFYVIIMMAFFQELPQELEESAYIDGANELSIFFRIILPVAKPILATMALFIAVQHWNAWFDTAYFTNSRSLRTISFLLIDLNNKVNVVAQKFSTDTTRATEMGASSYTALTIRMATMIVIIVPIICIYPFLQKHFVKGIMIGSIKG
jgi:putative aldouronate transport system permease protein